MKAVILAAGLGSRLRPLTDSVPKCMVQVNGIKIIDRQIHNLITNGIRDIFIVSGYKSEILTGYIKANYPFITVINNPDYSTTNNMYSLSLASDYVKGSEFLLMNADVYFDGNIIRGLIKESASSLIACDKSRYLAESMKIVYDGNRIVHISKNISPEEYYAVSIDVYRISAADSLTLFGEIERTINAGDVNSWTEVALDNIFHRSDFQPYIINGRWFEIDNHQDLAEAEKLFAGDML